MSDFWPKKFLMGNSEGTWSFAEPARDKTENIKIRAREKIPSPPKRKGVNRNEELQNSRNIVAASSGNAPLSLGSKPSTLTFMLRGHIE